MNRIKLILSVFIVLVSLASSCKKNKEVGDELITVNNSDHKIRVIINFNYPDTNFVSLRECLGCVTSIEPNSSYQHFYFPNNKYGWKDRISENNIHNTLTMYVIHGDTLLNNTFEEIQEDYNILRRYELSVEELESMNWTITYP